MAVSPAATDHGAYHPVSHPGVFFLAFFFYAMSFGAALWAPEHRRFGRRA